MKIYAYVFALVFATSAHAAEWNYKKPSFDPTGAAQLKTMDGALKSVSGLGQGGIQSSASPTVLSVAVGGDTPVELYNIAKTPPSGRYRAVLSEPLVVGEYYEIESFYHRTGGSGSNYGYYQCVPISNGVRIIKYTGPGQTFSSQSSCSTNSDGVSLSESNFKIIDSTTIDGSTSTWNEYYGYENHNIASVVTAPKGKRELYYTNSYANGRADLSEPLVVGKRYEIIGHYHRTGGSNHGGYYKCVPVSNGKSVFTYTGPGQIVKVQSSCMSGNNGHSTTAVTLTIVSDNRINGSVSEYNEYYGYDKQVVVSVIAFPDS